VAGIAAVRVGHGLNTRGGWGNIFPSNWYNISLLESRIRTTIPPRIQSRGQHLFQRRVVLSEVFVVIGVGDGLIWVGVRQVLTIFTAVSVVLGSTVVGEMGSLVDKSSGLGIGTSGGGGVPEGTTEVNYPEPFGIWIKRL